MKIKINKTTYKIKFVNKLKRGGRECYGLIHWEGRDAGGNTKKKGTLIEIVERPNKKHTIFHEITHALLAELADKKPSLKRLTDKCNSNENFVDEMSLLMMDCFEVKDND